MKSWFWEWIGLHLSPDVRVVRWFGPVIGASLILCLLVVSAVAVLTFAHFVNAVFQAKVDHAAIRNIGLILVAIFGGPFLVWRTVLAGKQTKTAEQSHITDQINKAVDGLGAEKTVTRIGRSIEFVIDRDGGTSDTAIEWQGLPIDLPATARTTNVGEWAVFSETRSNLEVRTGAIYALERISQDSLRDHIQIMEILTAYVRENSPVLNLDPTEAPFKRAIVRNDVQAALNVIGRRGSDRIRLEYSKNFRLDLREIDISGADLSNLHFGGAVFVRGKFEGTIFQSTNLSGARFQGALLNYADFDQANLCGAILDHAIFEKCGGLRGSLAFASDLRGLSIVGANIKGVNYLPVENRLVPTFGSSDTVLEYSLMQSYRANLVDIKKFSEPTGAIDSALKRRLSQTPFLYWSPFMADDLMTGSLRARMFKELGLTSFPYTD